MIKQIGYIKQLLEVWEDYLLIVDKLNEEERDLFVQTVKMLVYPRVEFTKDGNIEYTEGLKK